jgi:hypothetical protein
MTADFPLLPSDRYIADMLGLSEAQYRHYMAEVRRRALAGPRPSAVAEIGTGFFLYLSIISSLLSVGLTIAASFFKPKQSTPPRLTQNQLQGRITTNVRRYAPRQGFDSLQDIANIGDPIPLIYAKRELINNQYYGGIRINVPMVWSELITLDKSQILRSLFMIGEGDDAFAIDPQNTAIGNNTLGAYLLGNQSQARFSLYYRPNGGRIASTNLIAGSSNDPVSLSSTDVYATLDAAAQLSSDFVHSRRPNTQTQFGVYALIGNGLGFRVNPSFRPGVTAQLTPEVEGGGKKDGGEAFARVVCELDFVSLAQREKYKAKFGARSGLTSTSGSTWNYRLSKTTDALTVFQATEAALTWSGKSVVVNNPFPGIDSASLVGLISFANIIAAGSTVSGTVNFNTTSATTLLAGVANGTYIIEYYVWFESSTGKQLPFDHIVTASISGTAPNRTFSYTNTSVTYSASFDKNSDHQERCGDAAASVSGRQKTWDDAILVGELYKIGSALAICTARTPATEVFNSDSDFEPVTPSKGTTIDASFQVIRTGSATAIPAADLEKDAKSNPPFYTATNFPHLYRIAVGSFSTVRECRIITVGIRSSLGIRINGLCDFRDSLTLAQIDGKACTDKQGKKLKPGDALAVDIFASGQMTSSEDRYSFFRVRYREAGTDGAYTQLPQCFGIRGITQQNIFNSIRFIMPSTNRWEFQFEPLSGWEIRSGTATGDLELIDSSLSTLRSFTSAGIGVAFRGVVTSGNNAFIPAGSRASQGPEKFMLVSTQRGASAEIGIGYADGTSYVDPWGKLAEAFVYEEVRSSAESGPEHEIVYVDEQIANPEVPEYDNLAVLGLNMRAGVEWQQFGQLSVYVQNGLRSTHLFPEILQDLLTNPRYGKGDLISNEQLDLESFQAATAWCADRLLFFDGAIVGPTNLRQWAADAAAAHLLFFGESGGRFWLRPAWPGTVANPSAVPIKGIFTAGNIQEGSFAMEFFDPDDRQTIQVSVRYREERLSTALNNPGLFPVEKEILVREAGTLSSETDSIETLDLSDYVTNRRHALDAAKFVIRMRRIPDHAVRFSTTHEGLVAAIGPGDYIRVVMDVTHYDQLRNGAVMADGGLVSTQPFTDGEYNVFAWDGQSTTNPGPTTLTISASGSKASPTGIIFTLINEKTVARTYQIERITPADEGGYSVEAVHMPTDEDGYLLLAKHWGGETSDSNWIIQG